MKKIVFFAMTFMLSQSFSQTVNNFESIENVKFDNDSSKDYYNEFIDNQKTVFEKSNSETFLIDNVAWTRPFGESEYCLTPTMESVKEYELHIKSENNKDLNIYKSNFSFAKVNVTAASKILLNKVYISVPSYILNNVICYLPQIDIDFLVENGVNIEILANYGTTLVTIQETKDQDRATTIWSEGFESNLGQVPGSVYSTDVTGSNDCGWKDVSCYKHTGNYSVWCAGDGTDCNTCSTTNQPDYVNNMETVFFRPSYINTSDYNDVEFSYWIYFDLNDSGTNDDLNRYNNFGGSGSSWILAFTLTSSHPWDEDGWKNPHVSFSGQSVSQYTFSFNFTSNWTGTSYGVYLDDFELTGTEINNGGGNGGGNNGVGIDENNLNANLNIYPNPSNGNFTIELASYDADNIEITILDMSGKLVYSEKSVKQAGSFQKNIDLKNLSKGIYSVEIKTALGIMTQRLSVQ